MNNYFAHSGDLGDIIYSLPTIRACGGGELALFDIPGRTAHGMSQEKANRIMPLLELQPYISRAYFNQSAQDHALNGFRDQRCPRNLAYMHLATMGQSFREADRAWLTVDEPKLEAEVIFCRTSRYNNHNFPWQRVVDKYGKRAAFLGFTQEHKAFCDQFGHVPMLWASDLLAAARIIAGCKLYVGNYTSMTAIAEGLKHPTILEVFPHDHLLAMFHRMNCLHGWDNEIELPEV